MSGGSYDYAYRHIDDLAEAIYDRKDDLLRQKFAEHLRLCAKAAKDIEWEDSCDGADWEASVKKALAPSADYAEAVKNLVEAAKLMVHDNPCYCNELKDEGMKDACISCQLRAALAVYEAYRRENR